jgi:hypothetical protein
LRFRQGGESTREAGRLISPSGSSALARGGAWPSNGLAKRAISAIRSEVLLVGLGVLLRPAAQLAHGAAMVVSAPQVVVVERRQRAVDGQHLQPVPRQLQLADDLRPQQADHIRADAELEAGEDLFGDRRAAQDLAPFQDEDAPARSARYAAAVSPLWPPPMTTAS